MVRRRGMLSMELVLVLPIIALLLFGVCEFGLLFTARQSLVAASRSGARVGTLAGATHADVEGAVWQQLDPAWESELGIDVRLGRRSGDPVVVTLRVPMRSVSPDLLKVVGLSFGDQELVAETVMSKE